jgi:hypothetical protein
MAAIRRNCSLRSGSGTSAAKPLHSAAKRIHSSAYFGKFCDSDIALLLKGGSACISRSSAAQWTVPVIALKWGRVGYFASAIFQIFERVHCITELPSPLTMLLSRPTRRREFIAGLAGAAAWPVAARAQQRPIPVVGFPGSESFDAWRGWVAAFHRGLGDTVAWVTPAPPKAGTRPSSTAARSGFRDCPIPTPRRPWRPLPGEL